MGCCCGGVCWAGPTVGGDPWNAPLDWDSSPSVGSPVRAEASSLAGPVDIERPPGTGRALVSEAGAAAEPVNPCGLTCSGNSVTMYVDPSSSRYGQ